jgi:hypothetical protein
MISLLYAQKGKKVEDEDSEADTDADSSDENKNKENGNTVVIASGEEGHQDHRPQSDIDNTRIHKKSAEEEQEINQDNYKWQPLSRDGVLSKLRP